MLTRAQTREKLLDPSYFVPKLCIIDEKMRRNTLKDLRTEQLQVIEAFKAARSGGPRRICCLKTRQIGITTIVLALLFHRALFTGDPLGTLSLTHEGNAVFRVNQMLKGYHGGLPGFLRPQEGLPWNTEALTLGHNEASFRHGVAGGRGQGRSFTFSALHATEMGFWPRGSSATATTGAADRTVWASVLSTLHEGGDSFIIVESTANGPGGLFHDLVRTARVSEEWTFLFFPWNTFAEYCIKPREGFEPTDEESELMRLYDLSLGQIAWRRRKIVDDAIGVTQFRREFPINWLEPFLLSGAIWFDGENLNKMMAAVPTTATDVNTLEIYHPFSPLHRYAIGGDSGGGVDKDWSVWQIVRDDNVQAAVWRSNKHKPHQMADKGAALSAIYGRAPVACERNKYGVAVIERLESIGANVWKDDKGKDWWTQGGRGGGSKRKLYDFGAKLIDGGHMTLYDPVTISEGLHIREQKNGNIEADFGYHDDHMDALLIGAWAAREFRGGSESVDRITRIHNARVAAHRRLHQGNA